MILFCRLFLLVLLSLPIQAVIPAAIEPDQVAIVYRMNSEESQALAFNYARARKIPSANLIGLNLADGYTISRSDYNARVRKPLIEHFDREIWWNRVRDSNGITLPNRNKIRVLLLMKGVPSRIQRTKRPTGEDGKPMAVTPGTQDEASVDSELVYLGVSDYELKGPLNNPYFQKDLGISDPSLTPLLFTCRIDAPDFETCQRIIKDSMEVEETGLWGMCYLDEAHKGENYKMGDDWMRSIARLNRSQGIPTVVDHFPDTYATNYPMTDAACYYGWYAWNANGPLLNPRFKFKKGAVAIHLHSFSGSKIDNPKKAWVGPILMKGAAATVGNVWEPYLSGTHHFDILHDRLLKGYSVVEAAHMAMPTHSWQSVVIADPLYRPFLAQNQDPAMAEEDKDYRAFRLGVQKWNGRPDELTVKIRTAAARMASGRLYEALGLRMQEENKLEEAKAFFNAAANAFLGAPDKLRQTHHLIALHRRAGETEAALSLIAEAQERFKGIPEAKSLVGLRNILNPPPPPAAKSKVK